MEIASCFRKSSESINVCAAAMIFFWFEEWLNNHGEARCIFINRLIKSLGNGVPAKGEMEMEPPES